MDSIHKNISLHLFLIICTAIVIYCPAVSQTVDDPIGDIPEEAPGYLDIKKTNFRQSNDIILIDFYPNEVIPKGRQGGISTSTVFEIYMDVDGDSNTGVPLEDIGYDYKLCVDLFSWDGMSWVIGGDVFWNYDENGNPQSQCSRDRFYVFSSNLISLWFRWNFSLLSLDWTEIDWIARTCYEDQIVDQIPDESHAHFDIDQSVITEMDTLSSETVMFIYPTFFQDIMDQNEIVQTVNWGAQIESRVSGVAFDDIQKLQYCPVIQGAWSGNPVMIGPTLWKDKPEWFFYFHELGHNYTFGLTRFNQLYPFRGYVSMGGDFWNFGTNFVEAWATMIGLYAMHILLTDEDTYKLGSACKSSLKQEFDNKLSSYNQNLKSYESDPTFSKINPDILNGMFFVLIDSFGYEIIPHFFRLLQPPDESLAIFNEIDPDGNYAWSRTVSATVTCCAFSATAGVDLRDMFRNRWDFPICDSLYAEIQTEIAEIITQTSVFTKGLEVRDFQLLQNYPNPFNLTTNISFRLPIKSTVSLIIYDMLGKNVVNLVNKKVLSSGYHEYQWNAVNLSSGIYLYSLEIAGQTSLAKKCILIK